MSRPAGSKNKTMTGGMSIKKRLSLLKEIASNPSIKDSDRISAINSITALLNDKVKDAEKIANVTVIRFESILNDAKNTTPTNGILTAQLDNTEEIEENVKQKMSQNVTPTKEITNNAEQITNNAPNIDSNCASEKLFSKESDESNLFSENLFDNTKEEDFFSNELDKSNSVSDIGINEDDTNAPL